MITYPLPSEMLVIDTFKFRVGELVTTILGEYGVVIKIGKHDKYGTDKTVYYHVLIGGYVKCYMPFALIKIKNKNNP